MMPGWQKMSSKLKNRNHQTPQTSEKSQMKKKEMKKTGKKIRYEKILKALLWKREIFWNLWKEVNSDILREFKIQTLPAAMLSTQGVNGCFVKRDCEEYFYG